MTVSFKPAGYSTVSPYLLVEHADETIAFLVAVFDAVEMSRVLRDDGKIMHAEIRIDDSIIMLADEPNGAKAIPALVHIYVADVDETYRRALAAGAISLQEPLKQGDADKRAGVKQADGVNWWMATKVE
jgi:PhnB protein